MIVNLLALFVPTLPDLRIGVATTLLFRQRASERFNKSRTNPERYKAPLGQLPVDELFTSYLKRALLGMSELDRFELLARPCQSESPLLPGEQLHIRQVESSIMWHRKPRKTEERWTLTS